MTVDSRRSVIDSAQRLQKTVLKMATTGDDPEGADAETFVKDAFNVGMHVVLAITELADNTARMALALERIADALDSMAPPVGDPSDGDTTNEPA